MAQKNIAYFLSLPDEILLEEVFPRFSADVILSLCPLHWRFSNICQDEYLWKRKVGEEFPEFAKQKPDTIAWVDYYLLLENDWMLPLYYNGDRLGYSPFDPLMINKVAKMIEFYIMDAGLAEQTVNIVFFGETNEPIIVLKYRNGEILDTTITTDNYELITKVLFFVNDEFGKKPLTYTGIPPKERLRTLMTNREHPVNIIRRELISPLGHPPIYGDKKGNNSFVMIDLRRKGVSTVEVCTSFTDNNLHDILKALGVQPKSGNITWKETNYSKRQLCNLIRKLLVEIGHFH